MKRTISLALVLTLGLIASIAQAQIYDLQRFVNDQYISNHTFKLRLNIPESVEVVRGILINGNGAGGDATGSATNPEFVAFAESIGFAVLATGYWYYFPLEDDAELLLFEEMLQELADISEHPELVHAPWLPMGHSNGGQMSYGFNAKRPWKVIGFIASKGVNYNIPMPQTQSLLTPGMLIAGQHDSGARRANIKALFDDNRPRGALWAWVEEEGTGHEQANSQQLKITFLAECVRLRYPTDQLPLDGPIQLKDLHEFDGWLVDQTTWESGLTTIYPYDEAPGEKRAYGWVPSEKIARHYQAFSSYNKASSSVSGSAGVVTSPATLTYSIDLKPNASGQGGTDPVSKIEFFKNGIKIAESVAEPDERPSVSVEQHAGGFQAFSAIVSFESRLQKATHLRRVFVRGPRPPSAYEHWAMGILPDDPNGPLDTLFDDGVTNLERFAFGLSLTEPLSDFQPLQPTDPLIENIQGTDYVCYTYETSEVASQSGLNIMPQVSTDEEYWFNVTNIDDPSVDNGPIVLREDNIVTVKYPQSVDPLYFRVNVSDTYEGVENLIAHWKLDEIEGDIAYDSAADCDGTLIGGPAWQPTGGIVDGALAFDGIDDYVSTPYIISPADGDFSVFAWIKDGAPGQVILSQESGANWLMAGAVDGALRTDLKNPAGTTGRGATPPGPPLISPTVVTDGNWHRVGFVRDGSNRILYVDNIEVARDTAEILESADAGLYIGVGSALAAGTFFSGMIDDVRIYNRAVKP